MRVHIPGRKWSRNFSRAVRPNCVKILSSTMTGTAALRPASRPGRWRSDRVRGSARSSFRRSVAVFRNRVRCLDGVHVFGIALVGSPIMPLPTMFSRAKPASWRMRSPFAGTHRRPSGRSRQHRRWSSRFRPGAGGLVGHNDPRSQRHESAHPRGPEPEKPVTSRASAGWREPGNFRLHGIRGDRRSTLPRRHTPVDSIARMRWRYPRRRGRTRSSWRAAREVHTAARRMSRIASPSYLSNAAL